MNKKTMPDLTLEVMGLKKQYEDGTWALREISFSVQPGEMVGLLGSSGSGKSTLLRCLNGLIKPSEGQIRIGTRLINTLSEKHLATWRGRVGFIPQQFSIVDRRSVLQNVLVGKISQRPYWAGVFGYYPRSDREEALATLDYLGILDKAARRADSLSGGQQQRVAIARALMQDPLLLLADEPVASLDPNLANEVLAIFSRVAHDTGTPTIISLHSVELARSYCSRIIGIQEGKVMFNGNSNELNEQTISQIYGSDDSDSSTESTGEEDLMVTEGASAYVVQN